MSWGGNVRISVLAGGRRYCCVRQRQITGRDDTLLDVGLGGSLCHVLSLVVAQAGESNHMTWDLEANAM